MKAIIYQPTKSVMQAGLGNTKKWAIKPPANTKFIDNLTGWTGSDDTTQQVKLEFKNKEDAVAFAEKNKIFYEIKDPNTKIIKPNIYADNFK